MVAFYRDQGISGAKGRDKRPGLDKLLQAVARKEFDVVVHARFCLIAFHRNWANLLEEFRRREAQ